MYSTDGVGYFIFLARVARERLQYDLALNILSYVKSLNPNIRPLQLELIETKEDMLLHAYPIDKEAVATLVDDYDAYLKQNKKKATYVNRRKAYLYMKYLQEPKEAIGLYKRALRKQMSLYDEMDCKLNLAEAYLFNQEPWESALLYAQVEREANHPFQKDLAKLGFVQSAFYEGDYELAHENIKILRTAFDKDIANDALYLSNLIALFVLPEVMKEHLYLFGQAQLATRSHNFSKAQDFYQKLLDKPMVINTARRIHVLLAEIYYLMGQFDTALGVLDTVLNDPDRQQDDALYLKAKIYDIALKETEKAKSLYLRLLKECKDSVFVPEARKRLEQLGS